MIDVLKDLLEKERLYLNDFFDRLDLHGMERILKSLFACSGLIVLTGIGKSGLVAKKISVTMTSTGTRAIYLSATDALHGDLGILKSQDLFVFLSKSGESEELLSLVPFIRNRGLKMVGIISNENSRLAKAVDEVLVLPSEKEICPYDMAPTTSTTIQTIVGDVLAIALMQGKEVSMGQFAESHPAGRIGKRMLIRVKDLMLKESSIPLCHAQDTLVNTLVELTNKRCGCVLIVDEDKKLLGIFTDGDLRRALQNKGGYALESQMGELMTPTARWISPNVLAWDAMKMMEADQKRPITVLPVTQEDMTVIGLIKMHDIVQSGL